jgi:hypothetical protein
MLTYPPVTISRAMSNMWFLSIVRLALLSSTSSVAASWCDPDILLVEELPEESECEAVISSLLQRKFEPTSSRRIGNFVPVVAVQQPLLSPTRPRFAQAAALARAHQVLRDLNESMINAGSSSRDIEVNEVRLLQETVRLRRERDQLAEEANQLRQQESLNLKYHQAKAKIPLQGLPVVGVSILSAVVMLGFGIAMGHSALREGNRPLGDQEALIEEEPKQPFYNAEGMPLDADALRQRYDRRLMDVQDNPMTSCSSFCLWYCTRATSMFFLLFVFVTTFCGVWIMWNQGMLTTSFITQLALHSWVVLIIVTLAVITIVELGRLVTPLAVGILVEARKLELLSLRYGYHPRDGSLRTTDNSNDPFFQSSYRRGTAYKWLMCGRAGDAARNKQQPSASASASASLSQPNLSTPVLAATTGPQ